MKPPRLSDPPHVYRPLVKRRALTWVSTVTIFALAGYFFSQFNAASGRPEEGLYVLFVGILAVFGILTLIAAETLRLEISANGLVYRNAFGRITATRRQIQSLGAVKDNAILQLDENRYQSGSRFFWLLKAPYSDGSYIPIYLFVDRWESPAQLAATPVGRDLMRALPHLFGSLPPQARELDREEPPPAPVEPALEADQPLIAGHYRLRSKSSVVILAAVLLLAPLVMALAGLLGGGSQAVLLPGLVAGWLLTLLLGSIEARRTALTDGLGLAVVLLIGGLAALFLLAGCALMPGAVGCTEDGFQANLFAFFFYPFIMYLVPWLIFTRLPLLLRRK